MRRQLGFNLIEVMVALVILSVGVLGMAALQITSIKQNQSAYMRSQANQFAYDIVDRIRTNSSAISNYVNKDSGTEDSNCISYSGSASGCSTTEMAGNDLYEWLILLARELPNGAGRVCRGAISFSPTLCTTVPGSPVIVYVWWNDDRNGDNQSTVLSVSTEL